MPRHLYWRVVITIGAVFDKTPISVAVLHVHWYRFADEVSENTL